MSSDLPAQLEALHRDLRLKRLNPIWAKAEIVGGLIATGVGLAISLNPNHQGMDPTGGWLGLALFVFGAYLAMAGHRSHLYQSNNVLAVWLFRSIKAVNSSEATTASPASKEPT